jgi:high affinity Mn2+ porin
MKFYFLFLAIVSFSAHSETTAPYNFHFQFTTVSQEHLRIKSPYAGQNSLSSTVDFKSSLTATIFTGARIAHGTEVYFDPELSGGKGFNQLNGIAAYPNGEIYRVDEPSPNWNMARLFLKQTFEFGGTKEKLENQAHQIAEIYDQRRLTVVVGRFALTDYFDSNTYSHDPRTQFLNWALMDSGAWDYASDARGYSQGLLLDWHEEHWSLRYAGVMVSQKANGLYMDPISPTLHSDNLEFESRYELSDRPGAIRVMAFRNRANMGEYRTAINQGSPPDINKTHSKRIKYGFGLNAEQELANDLGAFSRLSWNDGQSETWAFTEIDLSLSLGLSLKGTRWSRPADFFGMAFVFDGLSNDHRDYLAAGGYGFIIGDGKLNYAPEQVLETFYLLQLRKDVSFTGDYQFIMNPAYNADRGPVSVLSLRFHYEI